jgi:cobalt-zinc-cadmium efflux system protein
MGANVAFTLIEVSAGLWAGSMALLADAGHNLGDSLGLFLSWGATMLARARPSTRRTYGLARSTILAALANALLILVGVGGVAWEAIGRLQAPPHVKGGVVAAVALIGALVNAGSALLFLRGREDANVRGAFIHLSADAAVSLGVVGAGLAVMATGWQWLDPVVSLLVSLVIVVNTWSLLRDSLDLALDAVPAHVDPAQVRAYLEALPEVLAVHDLHVWAMSTTDTALTAHLVMRAAPTSSSFLGDVSRGLLERFRIGHATLQIESGESADPCHLATQDGTCRGADRTSPPAAQPPVETPLPPASAGRR